MKDYYRILCVAQNASVSQIQEAIESARAIIAVAKNGSRGTRAQTIILKELREAESCLIHPIDRTEYDLNLYNYQSAVVEPYCDFAAIRAESTETWQEAISWDGKADISLYRSLLDQTVKLPHPDIQENILLAALLTPSALANMLPIIFCCGVPGSGKSNIGKLGLSIWGNNPMLASDTFSGIKRQLQLMATACTTARNTISRA